MFDVITANQVIIIFSINISQFVTYDYLTEGVLFFQSTCADMNLDLSMLSGWT